MALSRLAAAEELLQKSIFEVSHPLPNIQRVT